MPEKKTEKNSSTDNPNIQTERKFTMHFKLTKTVDIKDVFKVLKGINQNGKSWQILVVDKDYVNDMDVHAQLIQEFGLEVIDCGDKSASKPKSKK
jgi:hypothetical protein